MMKVELVVIDKKKDKMNIAQTQVQFSLVLSVFFKKGVKCLKLSWDKLLIIKQFSLDNSGSINFKIKNVLLSTVSSRMDVP
jgi:hypothetical protein